MLRRLRVLLLLAFRFAIRYLSGRRFTVPLPDRNKVAHGYINRLLPLIWGHLRSRTQDNRDLLTNMTVSLMFGARPHFEMPYRMASRPWSGVVRGRKYKLVGKPQITKYPPNGTLVGTTEWTQDYVSRSEQLTARRMARQLKRGAIR